MALVDVVIPTRNRVDLCVDAAESVRAQTFDGWRLFIVDDASGDPAVPDRLAEHFAGDDRVQVLRRSTAGRAPAARQDGFRAGSSPWVAILDSDDSWHPSKLERQVAVADGNDLVLTWFRWVRPDGSVRAVRRPTGSGRVSPFITNNMSMPMVSRVHLERRGGFLPAGRDSWMTVDNTELYLRLVPGADVIAVPEVLVDCRDHAGPRASDWTLTPSGAAELSRLLETYGDELARWPADNARLSTQAALRWSGAGAPGTARTYFRRAVAVAPKARDKLAVCRTFLPTYTRHRLGRASR